MLNPRLLEKHWFYYKKSLIIKHGCGVNSFIFQTLIFTSKPSMVGIMCIDLITEKKLGTRV